MRITRRVFAMTLLASVALSARAEYPEKAIRFIVPYATGGTTDLVARVVGEKVGARLGKPVVIENRPGAGGNIGMDAVAKAAPDGYTIGMGAISTNALNPHVYKSMAFDPRKDFTPIGMLGTSTIVLQVTPSLPVKNVAQLVEYLKKNPGMTYGTAGTGTSMHLAGVLFAQRTGTSLDHVAYKGSAPGINDMLGDHISMMFDNLPASLPHIKSGKLRAIAVAGKARSPSLPDVPTIAEAGVSGYAVEPWFAVYGPAGMPPAVVQALNKAYTEVLAMPDVKEKLTQAGFTPQGSSAAELAALGSSEYERLGKVARAAGMSMD